MLFRSDTVRDVLTREYPMANWEPEKVIPTDKGYGGRCDLYGEGSIVDLKTRDALYRYIPAEKKTVKVPFTVEELALGAKLEPYDSELPQLGGYGLALGCFSLANLYLSRSDPRAYVFRRYEPEEVKNAICNFEDLFRVFKRMRGLV